MTKLQSADASLYDLPNEITILINLVKIKIRNYSTYASKVSLIHQQSDPETKVQASLAGWNCWQRRHAELEFWHGICALRRT